MVLTCVARLFPRLTSVALLCGSRITPAIFAERMAALSITSIQLQAGVSCFWSRSCQGCCKSVAPLAPVSLQLQLL